MIIARTIDNTTSATTIPIIITGVLEVFELELFVVLVTELEGVREVVLEDEGVMTARLAGVV